jgi:hypothetical protein
MHASIALRLPYLRRLTPPHRGYALARDPGRLRTLAHCHLDEGIPFFARVLSYLVGDVRHNLVVRAGESKRRMIQLCDGRARIILSQELS